MKVTSLALVSLLMLLSPESVHTAQSAAEGWTCSGKEDLFNQVLHPADQLIVNNISVAEKSALMASELKNIQATYTATNQSKSRRMLDGQFYGTDTDGNVIFALSANPSFSMISENSTETVNGSVYAEPGLLDFVKTVCVKILAE